MSNEPQIGDVKVTECCSCGHEVECRYDADPYAEEIHGNSDPVWECPECRYQSAMDI